MIHRFHNPKFPSAIAAVALMMFLSVRAWSQELEFPAVPPGTQEDLQGQPPDPDSVRVENLSRGPLHEAVAEPHADTPEPGLIVEQKPPELIEEIPPGQAPEGRNVQWIPGYWGWDDAESRFIWISGMWRDLPPGHKWVPGYWIDIENGAQWISGFWSPVEQNEITYLPYPPESQERGPTYEAVSDDFFWVPGCWMWRDNDYAWRPGYWSRGYENWIWVPHRYTWTPRGAVFVSGYWDYPLPDRGLLFAPVYFHDPVWRYPQYRYTPNVVVNFSSVLLHLFVRPRYGHYYFGDYYGDRFARFGYHPWHTYSQPRFGYDPLLTYYGWNSRRRGTDFVSRIRGWHHYFDRHEDHRPRHTDRDFRDFVRSDRGRRLDPTVARQIGLTSSLQEVVSRTDGRSRFWNVERDQQNEMHNLARGMRDFQKRRAEVERSGRTDAREERGSTSRETARGHLKLPQTHRVLRPDFDRSDGRRDRVGAPGDTRQDRRVDDDRPFSGRPRLDVPFRSFGERSQEQRSRDGRSPTERSRSEGSPVQGPQFQRPQGERPDIQRPQTQSPRTERPQLDSRGRSNAERFPSRPQQGTERRPQRIEPPGQQRQGTPQFQRPESGRSPQFNRPESSPQLNRPSPSNRTPRLGPSRSLQVDRPSPRSSPQINRSGPPGKSAEARPGGGRPSPSARSGGGSGRSSGNRGKGRGRD